MSEGEVQGSEPSRARPQELSIDWLRSIAMLYIVGYWHLFEYGAPSLSPEGPIRHRVALVCLGLFILVSGYLAGLGFSSQGPLAPGWPAVHRFYRRRLLRIYPLFLLAVLLFHGLGLVDRRSAYKAAVLVSVFAKPAPQTLWFVCVLMILYIATPLFVATSRSTVRLVSLTALLIVVLALYGLLTKALDVRLVMYLPVFAVGIGLSRRTPSGQVLTRWAGAAFLASIFLSWFASLPGAAARLIDVPLLTTGALFVFALLRTQEPRLRASRIISLLSYGGFCAYLFHRPIMEVTRTWYFPQEAPMQTLYLVFVCLPLCLVAGWLLQRSYDAALAGVAHLTLAYRAGPAEVRNAPSSELPR